MINIQRQKLNKLIKNTCRQIVYSKQAVKHFSSKQRDTYFQQMLSQEDKQQSEFSDPQFQISTYIGYPKNNNTQFNLQKLYKKQQTEEGVQQYYINQIYLADSSLYTDSEDELYLKGKTYVFENKQTKEQQQVQIRNRMLQKINAQIIENYGQFEDQLKNQRKYMDNYQNQEMNGDWSTKDQNENNGENKKIEKNNQNIKQNGEKQKYMENQQINDEIKLSQSQLQKNEQNQDQQDIQDNIGEVDQINDDYHIINQYIKTNNDSDEISISKEKLQELDIEDEDLNDDDLALQNLGELTQNEEYRRIYEIKDQDQGFPNNNNSENGRYKNNNNKNNFNIDGSQIVINNDNNKIGNNYIDYEEEEIKSELEEFIKQEIQNEEEQESDYDFLSSDNDGEAYVSSEGEDSNYEITDSSDYEDEK